MLARLEPVDIVLSCIASGYDRPSAVDHALGVVVLMAQVSSFDVGVDPCRQVVNVVLSWNGGCVNVSDALMVMIPVPEKVRSPLIDVGCVMEHISEHMSCVVVELRVSQVVCWTVMVVIVCVVEPFSLDVVVLYV